MYYDYIRYSLSLFETRWFFEGDKLNLDKIESLKDTEKTKFLLMFLGFINSKHDIYSFESAKKHIYEECDVYKNW